MASASSTRSRTSLVSTDTSYFLCRLLHCSQAGSEVGLGNPQCPTESPGTSSTAAKPGATPAVRRFARGSQPGHVVKGALDAVGSTNARRMHGTVGSHGTLLPEMRALRNVQASAGAA